MPALKKMFDKIGIYGQQGTIGSQGTIGLSGVRGLSLADIKEFERQKLIKERKKKIEKINNNNEKNS